MDGSIPGCGQVAPQCSTAEAVSIDSILRSFNTWAYKREQPSDILMMRTVVALAIAQQSPLKFVLYWGKGPRAAIAEPDVRCLDFLAGMRRRVASAFSCGAEFHFLLTDTHARLNQHSELDIDAYYDAVAVACSERDFFSRRLSSIMNEAGPKISMKNTPAPNTAMISNLTQSAAKWYRGSGGPAEGAAAYHAMNMREKVAVQWVYPSAIFVTFNNSKSRQLFPDRLPIFYMYSLKKGVAVKPWFMNGVDEDSASVSASGQLQSHYPIAAE